MISRSLVLRTCEYISPKFFTQLKLFDCYHVKSFFYQNVLAYSADNKYDLYVICDTENIDFLEFVRREFEGAGTVIHSSSCSNEGSFLKQLELALTLNSDFIEFAEDDFLKKGKIAFGELNPCHIYTAYNHPNNRNRINRICQKVFNNYFTTVCSFIISRQVLHLVKTRLQLFGRITDSDMWRAITTPVLMEFLWNLKNNRISAHSGKRFPLRLLDGGAVWVHCATDSIAPGYETLLSAVDMLALSREFDRDSKIEVNVLGERV
jgi:hypothetical protein